MSLWQRWHPCGRCPGSIAIVAVAALASLRCWHHLGRCPGIAWALLAALASLRTLPWHCCYCCCRGAAIIAALALLRMLPWCCLGIVAVMALASLGMLPWRCCQCCRCSASITAVVAMAPLPMLFGHHQRCGAGVVILVIAWAVSPLQRGRQSPLLGVGPLGASAAISSCCCP